MPKSEENPSSESENETPIKNGSSKNHEKEVSEYEKQRLKRIEENKIRMEALGLPKMANSFMGSVPKTPKSSNNNEKRKGKCRKNGNDDDDEEYNPNADDEEEEEMSLSEEEEDLNDGDFSGSRKKKMKKNATTPKKRAPVQKRLFDSDFVDDNDDDALMKAIALSLQDTSGGFDIKSNSPSHGNVAKSKTPSAHAMDTTDKRNETVEDSVKRKRKKPMTSRVQMSEDEMLVHFLQFDETGKGGFTLRDIKRIALAHDFTWLDKEMADMILCFDNDGDGMINFDDFRKIVGRCNMLKGDMV